MKCATASSQNANREVQEYLTGTTSSLSQGTVEMHGGFPLDVKQHQ